MSRPVRRRKTRIDCQYLIESVILTDSDRRVLLLEYAPQCLFAHQLFLQAIEERRTLRTHGALHTGAESGQEVYPFIRTDFAE